MSGASIGQILSGAKPPKEFRLDRRECPAVWRNSYNEGQLEPRLWRPLGFGRDRGKKRHARRYAGAAMKAIHRLENRTRRERQKSHKGARNGIFGAIGVEVARYLYDVVDFVTGRLEPAISTIADALGYSYAAVHAALVRLRDKGFLHWVRRIRPKEKPDPFGPQVEQISNAYVLLLPKEVEELVRSRLEDGPPPDDASWSRIEATKAWQAMLDGLSAVDFIDATWGGDKLAGEAFKRIAAGLDAREALERESSTAREIGRI